MQPEPVRVDSEIGGFFALEISPRRGMHDGMIALNSARNCLIHLIEARGISSIHLPYYNCEVVEDAVKHFHPEIDIDHYHVDANFQPLLENNVPVECLYYVNYYGLCEPRTHASSCRYLLIDNAHALYAPVFAGADFIYCPRKFVGVADGGYLSTAVKCSPVPDQDTSWEHSRHLLRRLDSTAAEAYNDFQQADRSLRHRPVRRMSLLTSRILQSIDHDRVKHKRLENFAVLHASLRSENALSPLIDKALTQPSFVPFCYPFLTDEATKLRQALIRRKVYVPIYWPELCESAALLPTEHMLVKDILCLPIDQRYGEADMFLVLAKLREIRE